MNVKTANLNKIMLLMVLYFAISQGPQYYPLRTL